MTSTPDPDEVAHAERALGEVIDEWMARRGVLSVEVARRWRNGEPTSEVGIRIVVEEKLPRDQVPPGELFPRRLAGFAVDVEQGKSPGLQTVD